MAPRSVQARAVVSSGILASDTTAQRNRLSLPHRRPWENLGLPPCPRPVGGRLPRNGWRSQRRNSRSSRPASRARRTAWANSGEVLHQFQTEIRETPAADAASRMVQPSASFVWMTRCRQSMRGGYLKSQPPSIRRGPGRGGCVNRGDHRPISPFRGER